MTPEYKCLCLQEQIESMAKSSVRLLKEKDHEIAELKKRVIELERELRKKRSYSRLLGYS